MLTKMQTTGKAGPQSLRRSTCPFSRCTHAHCYRYKDDGDEVIRKLDGMEWGYKRRPLKVQWAQVSRSSWDNALAAHRSYHGVKSAWCYRQGANLPSDHLLPFHAQYPQ